MVWYLYRNFAKSNSVDRLVITPPLPTSSLFSAIVEPCYQLTAPSLPPSASSPPTPRIFSSLSLFPPSLSLILRARLIFSSRVSACCCLRKDHRMFWKIWFPTFVARATPGVAANYISQQGVVAGSPPQTLQPLPRTSSKLHSREAWLIYN